MNPSFLLPSRERVLPDALVYIVDDDPHMNGALADLLRSVGIASRGFLAAQEFLQSELEDLPGCLVLDVRLRGTNGLDLQEHLRLHGIDLPIIFVTAHGDIEMSVRAMKAGAHDFLTKPFRDQVFLDAVSGAIEADRCKRATFRCGLDLRARFSSLSDREREVMLLAASGLMNKQIAGRIGISEVTIKIHRSKAMRKMAARTFADLVKMVHELGDAAARQEPAFAVPRATAMPAARAAG